MPSAPALLLGLLTASLPSIFIVGLNPHLDSLYAGLGAVLLASALRALSRPPSGWVYLSVLLCSLLLIGPRYHVALVVIPVALVLLFSRAKSVRPLGLAALLVGLSTIVAALCGLHLVTGDLRTAGIDQVRTGAAYREHKTEAEISRVVFDDYAGWQRSYQAADPQMVLKGIADNWPQYLTRKAVLGG